MQWIDHLPPRQQRDILVSADSWAKRALQRVRAEAMAEVGYTLTEASRESGVTLQRVQQIAPGRFSDGRRGVRPKVLDNRQISQMQSLVNDGLTVRQTARLFGFHEATLNNRGVKSPRRDGRTLADRVLTEFTDALALAVYVDGGTQREAAEIIGEDRAYTCLRIKRATNKLGLRLVYRRLERR